jgi:hypothetical protein
MSRSSHRAAPAHRTTGRLVRPTERQVSAAIAVIAYSPIEEDFFRAGDALSEGHHDFSDLDAGYERPTLWRAVVGWLRGERNRHPE